MKKILITLLAASLSMVACKKQPTAMPVQTGQLGSAGIKDARALVVSTGSHKKSQGDLELDYDLIIKKVADNKFEAAISVNHLVSGSFQKDLKGEIEGIVLTLSTSDNGKSVPLATLKASTSDITRRNTIVFPAFGYDGDLAYELVDVATSLTVQGGNLVIGDNVTFNIGNSSVSYPVTSGTIVGGNMYVSDDATLIFNGKPVQPGFGIMIDIKTAMVTLTDNSTVFVLPSGITEVQNPVVAKVKMQQDSKGNYGYVTATMVGDPAGKVNSMTFQPASVSANDPKDPKAMIDFPVMKFEITHTNKKNGVIRLVSTQTWSELYGKTLLPTGTTSHFLSDQFAAGHVRTR